MDEEIVFFMVFAFVCLVVLVVWASVLTSLARVQDLDASGITLRTLAGRKRLAWADLRAPVRFWSRTVFVHVVLALRQKNFLALRRNFMVVGGLEESKRVAEALSQYIEVAQSRVF